MEYPKLHYIIVSKGRFDMAIYFDWSIVLRKFLIKG